MGDAERSRSNTTPLVAAIIVWALIVAGAIFMAASAAPDECEKWNHELGNAAVGVRHTRTAVADFKDHPGAMHIRASLVDAESEMRTLLAEKPEDCEMDDWVEAEVRRVTDL